MENIATVIILLAVVTALAQITDRIHEAKEILVDKLPGIQQELLLT